MPELHYGCRMSVLSLDSDGEPESFRHPTEPCHGCLKLVISAGKSSVPIVCEECLEHIRINGRLTSLIS